MKRNLKNARLSLKCVIKKHLKIWGYYALALAVMYGLWYLLDYLPRSYASFVNLISLSLGFFMTIFHLKKYNNPFIPIVLLCYTIATIIEIQSNVYNYTNMSYKVWAIGNWMVPLACFFEIYKVVKDVDKIENEKQDE